MNEITLAIELYFLLGLFVFSYIVGTMLTKSISLKHVIAAFFLLVFLWPLVLVAAAGYVGASKKKNNDE
jgi:hypothetical protein